MDFAIKNTILQYKRLQMVQKMACAFFGVFFIFVSHFTLVLMYYLRKSANIFLLLDSNLGLCIKSSFYVVFEHSVYCLSILYK